MSVKTISFDLEGLDGGIESRRIGNRIEIAYQGCPVMGFEVEDLNARDWTIASLLQTPLNDEEPFVAPAAVGPWSQIRPPPFVTPAKAGVQM